MIIRHQERSDVVCEGEGSLRDRARSYRYPDIAQVKCSVINFTRDLAQRNKLNKGESCILPKVRYQLHPVASRLSCVAAGARQIGNVGGVRFNRGEWNFW